MKTSGKKFMRSGPEIRKFLCIVVICLLPGCRVAPGEREASDIITHYFQAKTYRVLELNITDIQPLALRNKTYMGTDAYTVFIHSITLGITENSGPPWFYRTGQEITFRDAVITIKEVRGKRGTWTIHNITGIAVP